MIFSIFYLLTLFNYLVLTQYFPLFHQHFLHIFYSHWARHIGATILLNRGIPMQIVAKICSHSSTRITEQVYAKLLDETVVDAIKGLNI